MADINQEIATWSALVDEYLLHRDRRQVKSPGMPWADARLSLYGTTGNALVTELLTFKMIKTTLLSNPWWQANVPNLPEHEKRQHQTEVLVDHSKIATFVLFFSFYESVIRVILRAVKPGACDNGFAAFASVYTALFTHLNLQAHIPVLDFGRTIRNLIHNNGTYLNNNGRDESLTFNGTTYVFEHGRRVQFVYVDLLVTYYRAMLTVSDDINAAADVIRLPTTLAS